MTPHAVVVPRLAACSNPGCRYVHRMAALVPGLGPLRVEGDLFVIGEEAGSVIDELETGAGAPYVRGSVTVVALEGSETCDARAYFAREPARWRALVDAGRADALAAYPPALATDETLKACCVRAPGHAPPHDVLDPLEHVPAAGGSDTVDP